MQIRIKLENWEPPEGVICMQPDDGDELFAARFDGWLGLIGRLYELIGRAEQRLEADTGVGGGEGRGPSRAKGGCNA